MYNYGARFYDPAISRFLSVDPLASDFPSWNPYHYVFNNPLKFTDPTGMAPESPDDWIRTSSGAIIYDASVKDLASTHERYGTKSQYLGKSLTFLNGDGQQVSLNENGFALRSVLLDAVSITANRNENSRSSSVATTTGVAISATDAVIDGSVSLAGATNELANTTKSIGKVTRVGSGVAGGIGVANDFASTVDNPSIGNGFKTGFSLGSVLYGLGSKSNPYITVGLGALDIIGVKDKIGTSIDKSIDYLQYQNFLYQQKLEVKSVRE